MQVTLTWLYHLTKNMHSIGRRLVSFSHLKPVSFLIKLTPKPLLDIRVAYENFLAQRRNILIW